MAIKYVAAKIVAKRTGVEVATLKSWVRKGKIKGKLMPVVRQVLFVDDSLSINRARELMELRCVWCGNVFTALHPGKAKYCCKQHRELDWHKTHPGRAKIFQARSRMRAKKRRSIQSQ